MELRHYLQVLRKRAWLLVLAPLLAGTVSLVASRQMRPVYQASATLLITQRGGTSSIEYSSLLGTERIARTYAELLTIRPILEKVISDLQLRLTPFELSQKVTVIQPDGTQLLEIRVEDNSPQLAVAIANSLSVSFLEKTSKRQSAELSSHEQMLLEQIAQAQHEIAELEDQREEENQSAGEMSSDDLSVGPDPSLSSALRDGRLAYATLLESYLRLQAASGRSILVEIVEPAAMPTLKVRPRVFFNTIVAAFAGLILALGLAFLLDYLDVSLAQAEDVERVLHIPTLTTVPSARIRGSENERPFVVARPTSGFAEAFRSLRTNIQFSNLEEPVSTLLVTSPNSGEGKTTVVANLGVVMAQNGKRVLLVDADLRRASLHRYFGMPNRKGLTNILRREESSLDDWLEQTETKNLRVLTSGPLPSIPSELLGLEHMQEVIRQLNTVADIVLLDSPPVLAVTDAAILASCADGVLLVLESGRTPKVSAHQALGSLQSTGARVLGAVLNQSKDRRDGYYYQEGRPADRFLSRWKNRWPLSPSPGQACRTESAQRSQHIEQASD